MSLRALVDLDDLYCEEQITKYLLPIKEVVPTFKCILYSIPNKLGPVHDLKLKYPWITFAIHGWEHVPFECRAWTQEEAESLITKALDMGYAKLFKPPNWTFDEELVNACTHLGVVLHHHKDEDMTKFKGLPRLYPGPKQWQARDHINLHSHIQQNPVTDWVGDHPAFRSERMAKIDEFLTIEEVMI